MTAIKVNFEIGHEASLRTKKTPEGFTHDWEVFVRGQEGADISHFVDKVVFHLHETFPKPKRVVKEPPFSIKESGYAGFIFPIEIYLKNRDEPKKIKFTYDLTLQQSGFLKDRYVFHNPNEDFKKKLIKGGGIIVSNNTAFYTNPDQENRSRDSFSEEKQVASKPKPPSDNVKKHKSKEHKEEIPLKSCFEDLFGRPIQKPPKIIPEIKKVEKNNFIPNIKSEKKDKEKLSSDKKPHKEHKEAKSEKSKNRDEKDKIKSEKSKSHKDAERSKEKAIKRPMERIPSPDVKKRCPSPTRRPPSPPPVRSSSASSVKEDYKPQKLTTDSYGVKKAQKNEDKQSENKIESEIKEKKKKEKKSHDRDKEKKERKEHKKESQKLKDSPKEPIKENSKESSKTKEIFKDIHASKEKVKSEKPMNKFSIENLKKSPLENGEHFDDQHKVKDKGDSERKHKHKKKDKKRDDRDKQRDSGKEKKHKDKNRESTQEKPEVVERRETPIENKRFITESASPISIDTASQCSSKSGIAKVSLVGVEDIVSSHSESEESLMADEDVELKVKTEHKVKVEPSPEPQKERELSPIPEPEPEPVDVPTPHKEKSKKHKDKSSKREEKKRKRKLAEEESESRKAAKSNDPAGAKVESEFGESSGINAAETKLQDNGVSSSLGEDAEPGDLSPDYMVQLRGLQQRIMTIKSNEELVRVVNLIAETGRYEVTTQTFDFDLCLLDRSTVQQLIQLVGC